MISDNVKLIFLKTPERLENNKLTEYKLVNKDKSVLLTEKQALIVLAFLDSEILYIEDLADVHWDGADNWPTTWNFYMRSYISQLRKRLKRIDLNIKNRAYRFGYSLVNEPTEIPTPDQLSEMRTQDSKFGVAA